MAIFATANVAASQQSGANPQREKQNLDTRGLAQIVAFSQAYSSRHWIPRSLQVCIFAVAVSFTLDQSTIGAYGIYGLNALERQSYNGVLAIVAQVIAATAKPVLAYVADGYSRQTCYVVILISNVVGYIIIATAPSAVLFVIGRLIAAPGRTGYDFVTITLVSDLSPLQWRGFMIAMVGLPYLFFSFPWR